MKFLSDIKKQKDSFYRKIVNPLIPYSLFLILAGSLLSCSEDIDFSDGVNVIPDDCIELNLAVPDPISVRTRGDNDINSLTIYIFTQQGAKIQESEISPSNITGNRVAVPLSGAARNNTVLVYAVANASNLGNITSPADLRNYILQETRVYQDKNGKENIQENLAERSLPMIGFEEINTNNTDATIYLYRTVAKIYTTCTVTGVTVPEFHVFQYNTKAYLGAPKNTEEENIFYSTDNKNDYISTKQLESFNSATSANSVIPTAYVYPTKGFSGNDLVNGGFIVVKVQKDNKDLYYRINLRKTDSNGDLRYLDLNPNYQYEIRITGILNEGYDSYEEAARHPDCDQYLTYEIHDHAAEIFSMVTDGYNELGVTPEINLTQGGEVGKQIMVVKCFNPDDTNITDDKIEILDVTGKNVVNKWIIVEYKGPHYYSDDFGNNEREKWDKDTPGNQFEYDVYINPDKNVYEDASWEFIVKWNGLERKVKVNYTASFLLPEVCTVKLTIKDNDTDENTAVIKDYWTFITSQGTSKEKEGTGTSIEQAANTPKLWGILPEDMTGEKKRTNGFHFPMPYGKTNKWEYEYEVDFTNLTKLPDTGSSIGKIQMAYSSSENVLNLEWDYTSGTTGTLKFIGDKSSYVYDGGNITFTITYNDNDHLGQSSEIIASIYHTGFFHYEGDSKYAPQADFGYYYYEVVPMGNEGDYWLDRNIGAKSNKSFIAIENYTEDSDTEEDKKNRESTGLYYSISEKPKTFADEDFKPDPVIDLGMCPPGYHIPNSTEFDALRLSKNFVTQNVIMNHTYYQSTYYMCGGKIGNIYLQKARYYNEDNIVEDNEQRYTKVPNNGDAGAGYYWTMTTAPGTEKEQTAAWLRGLYLNGSSSTYVNSSIADHRMPIRCKAGVESAATKPNEYYISLNVHDVTHVYLFDLKTKSPLYTFPGKAVGTTSSAVKWQHFYCSTTEKPEDLLMLFVKVEKEGKVIIYKKNGTSFTYDSDYHEDYLTSDYAWNVEYGAYYDFCEKGKEREDNVSTTQPDGCNQSSDGGGGNQGGDNPGGGDTGEIKPGGNEVGRGDSLSPEGTIIWKGNVSLSWNENKVLYDYWDQIPEGTKLRIYGISTGSGDHYVAIRPQNWNGKFLNTEDGYFQYTNVNGYVEIELTSNLLRDIINKKLMITGTGFNLQYVTLITPDGSKVPMDPDSPDSSEIILWSGEEEIKWYPGLELISERWASVTGSGYLRIYCELLDGDKQLQYGYINSNGSQFPSNLTSGAFEKGFKQYSLSATDVSNLKTCGLRITGAGIKIKYVSFKPN